ncbi:putative SNRNP27 domain-containing protein [[Candida] railenensis]|uniref:SNRNP27 domain-containing protein n=1 Tax=[Candida] railenensis TaxID=45579 RepID=A0A9P0QRH0_9ASCO|nr:putative SNRNP27 domain-containing protein [[Candida] railenensis]
MRINLGDDIPDSKSSHSPRSRSRSPDSLSTQAESSYRERSQERGIDKVRKSGLYRNSNNSVEDLALASAAQGAGKAQEQPERGRSKERVRSIQRGDDPTQAAPAITKQEGEEDPDEEEDPNMISLMGFTGFASTKGKQVKGAKGGAAKKEKKTEYRQYMNRTKGFNRPLSPTRGDK